jgi:hypothetical protein
VLTAEWKVNCDFAALEWECCDVLDNSTFSRTPNMFLYSFADWQYPQYIQPCRCRQGRWCSHMVSPWAPMGTPRSPMQLQISHLVGTSSMKVTWRTRRTSCLHTCAWRSGERERCCTQHGWLREPRSMTCRGALGLEHRIPRVRNTQLLSAEIPWYTTARGGMTATQ